MGEMSMGDGMRLFDAPIPRLCIPVSSEACSCWRHHMKRAEALNPEAIEWRIDACAELWDDGICVQESAERVSAMLLEYEGTVPIIITLRPLWEGGQSGLSDVQRARILSRVLETGRCAAVDFEMRAERKAVAALQRACDATGTVWIASHHDFRQTPDFQAICNAVTQGVDLGAQVVKVAYMARIPEDSMRLMEGVYASTRAHGCPVIGVSMGEMGIPGRLYGAYAGSALTYVRDTEDDLGSAPGQMTIDMWRRCAARLIL